MRAHADLAPTLAALASPAGDLSAPCPSTTPVSLATLGTGLPPGSHGILGFVTDRSWRGRGDRGGQALNHVRWADDPDPRRVAGATARSSSRPPPPASTSPPSGPYAYAGSGLTARRLPRGAAIPASVGPRRPDAPGSTPRSPPAPRTLVYGYLAELDLTGHVRGVDSPAWRAQLQLVDRMVEQLVDGLPDDAALLVTADHGMLDVADDTRLDLDGRSRPGRRRPAARRRAAGPLRARRARCGRPTCCDRWRAVLGDRAWVVDRDEAIASGIFGPVDDGARRPHRRRRRTGPRALGLWSRRAHEPGPSRLAAYHGSLTATELAIPLLAARGRALG